MKGTTMDVIVAGAGSAGLSLGLVLARRGVRVAVVGRPQSPGAAAVLGAFGDVTSAVLKSPHGRTKLDWTHRASKLWPEWLASLSDGTELMTAHGTVVVLNTVGLPDVDTANYHAIRTALESYDEPFEDLDPEDVDWLDPEPTARPMRAMFLPQEHAVNAHLLLLRLEQAFLAAGGVLVPEAVVRAGRGVELESGTSMSAGNVVLTQPPGLVNACAVSALVDTDDGTLPRSVIRTPNRAFASGACVIPHGNGQLQVGAMEVFSPSPRTAAPVGDVLHLLNCAARQIRRGVGESGVREIQLDNRPVSLDGLPLLGETDEDGVWVMTGPHQDSLTLVPLLANEMAALLLGEETAADLDLLRPTRTPAAPLSRAETVAAAVTHLMATGYESNWAAPVEWPALLEATAATELYRNPAEAPGGTDALIKAGMFPQA
ncbi:hypothetical protein ALI144C_09845 [Actinosynnema sp. ALI-1.44]|uniref:NAD(P)/FAD-dependent oxidoreductase n=1 Tax=Actinosynnema sp. ALI-1.44 TaxID=1933779 RepID=UPI00097CBDBA|nr:FAD-binding oxidoreductase [Actinosynnema sp. ALI-1.44]ONI86945.1 hypothetical protein ALI144C_09845 [Actinosynnema sp. ALI-1.44]